MTTLSILMPSRLARARDGGLFLERAVHSIRGQVRHSHKLQILIGIDAGAAPPPGLDSRLGVTFVESAGNSQAAALNAAAQKAEGDFIAILEDDDQWNPGFLYCVFSMLEKDFDFSSSTQLEVNEEGQIIQISEYPIPSS